jgi:hypothetical protein
MSRFITSVLALLLIALAGNSFVCVESVYGQKGGDEFTLSGPYAHKNLSVFFVHGSSAEKSRKIVTLQEALDLKIVVIYETGQVNELSIENISIDVDIFIQAGDIVKGGKQDRVIGVDMILPPKSGRVPINSYCVEHGRWSQRGKEESDKFTSASERIATKDALLAFQHDQDQQKVWNSVSKAQTKLSQNLGSSVASPQSASSYQLTLENAKVRESTAGYVKGLYEDAQDKDDAVGCVFLVNGKMYSADIYASHALFSKVWAKLLKAASVEAIAEYDKDLKISTPSTKTVGAWLADAQQGQRQSRKVNDRTTMITKETEKTLLFESQDSKRGDVWLHRNYLAK